MGGGGMAALAALMRLQALTESAAARTTDRSAKRISMIPNGRWAHLAPLAGPSWQSAQVGVGGLGGLDADAAVDGLDAVGAGDDGAQVELGDLRQVIGHPGDPQQHILE